MGGEDPDSAHQGDAPIREARRSWLWRAPALLAALAAGAAAAWLAVQRSGVVSGSAEAWTYGAGWWPASTALVALITGTACYGLIALVMLAGGWQATIQPNWRADAACAAIALGPFLVGAFFAVIGITATPAFASPFAWVLVAVLFVAGWRWRRMLGRLAERLLLSLFLWLALLTLPTFLHDPVSRTAVAFMLDLYRRSGLIG